MSNEELVTAIQEGNACMEDLWEQVKGLVKWKAHHIMAAIEGRGGVEFDDLYQTGYLAMVEAVNSYKSESGAFSSWFIYYLKSAFAVVTGYRTKAGINEPLNNFVSLDKPLSDDADSNVLMDIFPDPAGEAPQREVEERIYLQQLHDALEEALRSIPLEQQEVLRCRYYQNRTLMETAEHMGISPEAVRKNEGKGLQRLRGPGNYTMLRPFYDFNFFAGTGVRAFKNSGMSIQERYLVYEESQEYREKER